MVRLHASTRLCLPTPSTAEIDQNCSPQARCGVASAADKKWPSRNCTNKCSTPRRSTIFEKRSFCAATKKQKNTNTGVFAAHTITQVEIMSNNHHPNVVLFMGKLVANQNATNSFWLFLLTPVCCVAGACTVPTKMVCVACWRCASADRRR